MLSVALSSNSAIVPPEPLPGMSCQKRHPLRATNGNSSHKASIGRVELSWRIPALVFAARIPYTPLGWKLWSYYTLASLFRTRHGHIHKTARIDESYRFLLELASSSGACLRKGALAIVSICSMTMSGTSGTGPTARLVKSISLKPRKGGLEW